MEDWAAQGRVLSEEMIRQIHALVEYGTRARSTPYRDGQNVIRNSINGGMVYLPPESKDVPGLMYELANWVNQAEKENIPVP